MPSPVIFLVFNRPAQTARVFARIREARPQKLFVVADGPRRNRDGEAERCRVVREMIEKGVDWPCELVRDYSEVNLGCARRVYTGITSVFQKVEDAIILEDDCLPHATFFPYCNELLERYRMEPRVGMISGSHHLFEPRSGGDSYYFCRYGNIWGWATWRRAWRNFDYTMSDWPYWKDTGGAIQLFPRKEVARFWTNIWDRTFDGRIDSWGYRWTYYYLRQGMLGVLPRVSLVENIGFGGEATHTTNDAGEGFRVQVEPMDFPLKHPALIEPDYEAEECASSRYFSYQSFLTRFISKIGRIYLQ